LQRRKLSPPFLYFDLFVLSYTALSSLFGIPIGVLGAGFEEIVTDENEDGSVCEIIPAVASVARNVVPGTRLEQVAHNFVNGRGSALARWFETIIYFLIFATVAVGALQTIKGQENSFHQLEWFAVAVFTVEYIIRLVGAGSDPEFAYGSFVSVRLRFIVSFYSLIDLLAIVPFYLAYAMPQSVVNEYDEYLRMLRILRLLKLDKYVPAISLIDDVLRLKYNSLKVALFAAVTLWVLFSAALFLCEHDDKANEIDPVPLYNCQANCTMADRFRSFFDSMIYAGKQRYFLTSSMLILDLA
jgi:hypothetical protein